MYHDFLKSIRHNSRLDAHSKLDIYNSNKTIGTDCAGKFSYDLDVNTKITLNKSDPLRVGQPNFTISLENDVLETVNRGIVSNENTINVDKNKWFT